MIYKYVIFDYDGTLADSQRGIMEGARRALAHFGITSTEAELHRFVGPDLWYSFNTFYGFDKKQQDEAVDVYREYYDDNGIYDTNLYPGMRESLDALSSAGVIMAVATAKPERTVLKALNYLNITDCFACIAGSFPDGRRSGKKELTEYVMANLRAADRRSVLYIGDSRSDCVGSHDAGIDFMAALYDRPETEFSGLTVEYKVYNAGEIKNILL